MKKQYEINNPDGRKLFPTPRVAGYPYYNLRTVLRKLKNGKPLI
jgi:hypothetical protein